MRRLIPHGRAALTVERNRSVALYKYAQYVTDSNDNVFDGEHRPGSLALLSGIYRCLGCGRECVSTQAHPLPSQNHHEHSAAQGAIRWRLAVYADHRPKA
jgi:hypothetical protein